MYPNILKVTLLIFPIILISQCWNPFSDDHDYFDQKIEFMHTFSTNQGYSVDHENSIFNAEFIKMTDDPPQAYSISEAKFRYKFREIDSGVEIYMFTFNFSDTISFIEGTVYEIYNFSRAGWPSSYGLLILDNDEMFFSGVSGWNMVDTLSNLYKNYLKVSLHRVLNNHYRENECVGKIINTEIKFQIDTDVIFLHQGQSDNLGNFHVNLGIAKTAKGDNGNCTDAGFNGVSYTISKI